jgi:hypothetical protein
MYILKFFRKQKIQLIPSILLACYAILVGLDLLTTFLCSPDLKYEANPIIRYFALNWTSILISNFVIIAVLIITAKISDHYIIKIYYHCGLKQGLLKKILFIVTNLFILLFYCQLITELFTLINNYLNYIYLSSKHNHILYHISVNYADLQKRSNPLVLFFVLNFLGHVTGLVIMFFRISYVKKHIKKQYER